MSPTWHRRRSCRRRRGAGRGRRYRAARRWRRGRHVKHSKGTTMIIDCHGHYTTAPRALKAYREAQIAGLAAKTPAAAPSLKVSDDEIRESIEKNQLRIQRERGVD